MSHTPGPWSWWTSNSYRRLTAEGKQDGGVLSAVSASGHADVRVSEVDARLIAAAPCLLEVLEALHNRLENLVAAGKIPMPPALRVMALSQSVESMRDEVAAAIANVTGEQQ